MLPQNLREIALKNTIKEVGTLQCAVRIGCFVVR